MNLNKVLILGNVTRDPELRAMPNGGNVASLGIATNRTWKDKAGQKQQEAEFHNVVAFGKLADIIGQYAKKGALLLIEGRLKTQSWEKDGIKRYKTEIIAENMQLGPRPQAQQERPYEPAAPVNYDEIPVIEENQGAKPADEIDVNSMEF